MSANNLIAPLKVLAAVVELAISFFIKDIVSSTFSGSILSRLSDGHFTNLTSSFVFVMNLILEGAFSVFLLSDKINIPVFLHKMVGISKIAG